MGIALPISNNGSSVRYTAQIPRSFKKLSIRRRSAVSSMTPVNAISFLFILNDAPPMKPCSNPSKAVIFSLTCNTYMPAADAMAAILLSAVIIEFSSTTQTEHFV